MSSDADHIPAGPPNVADVVMSYPNQTATPPAAPRPPLVCKRHSLPFELLTKFLNSIPYLMLSNCT